MDTRDILSTSSELEVLVFRYASGYTPRLRSATIPSGIIGAFSNMYSAAEYKLATITKDDLTLYVGPGIILDRDMNPLFFLTECYDYDERTCIYTLRKILAKVSPKVYKVEDAATKFIKNKIIPAIFNTSVLIDENRRYFGVRINENTPVELVVRDLDDIFMKVDSFDPNTFDDVAVNDAILSHTELLS